MIITPNIGSIERRLCARMKQWAPQLAAAEMCYGVDPFTLAAIIDRESEGGGALTPPGPEGRRADGFGLAQLHQDEHVSFLLAQSPDGKPLWTDPSLHILYTAKHFRRLVDAFQLAEGIDLPPAIAAFDIGVRRVRIILAQKPFSELSTDSKIATLDEATTGKDYVSDVLSRRASFIGASLP